MLVLAQQIAEQENLTHRRQIMISAVAWVAMADGVARCYRPQGNTTGLDQPSQHSAASLSSTTFSPDVILCAWLGPTPAN